jgi:hypothetical protein
MKYIGLYVLEDFPFDADVVERAAVTFVSLVQSEQRGA